VALTEPHGIAPERTFAPRLARLLAEVMATAAVPLLVLSQWLSVRWRLPARPAFNATIAFVLVAILVLGYRRVFRDRLLFASSAVALVVLVAATLIDRVPPTVAMRGSILYLGLPLAVVAGLAADPRPETAHRAVLVAAWTAGIVVAAAAAQVVLGRIAYVLSGQDLSYPRWWERGRAVGFVANPGRLGQLGSLWVAFAATSGGGELAAMLLAVGGGAAVGTSGTRTALVASAALLGVWFVFRDLPHARPLAIGAGAALVTFVAVVALVPAARNDLLGRNGAMGDAAADVRTANVEATLALVRDRPLFGAGPGRFGSSAAWRTGSELHARYGLPDVRSPEYVAELRRRGDTREIDVGTPQLDLGWAQIAAELGLAGLVAYLGLLAVVAWRGWRWRSPMTVGVTVVVGILSLAAPAIVDFSLITIAAWWAVALRPQPAT